MNNSPALFLVCNHNYFLAHMMHCAKGYKPLLPNFRGVIMDEAHQLYATVQSMYGSDITPQKIDALLFDLRDAKQNACANVIRADFDKIYAVCNWQAKQQQIYRRRSDCQQTIRQAMDTLKCMLDALTRLRHYKRLCARLEDAWEVLRRFYEGDERYFCFIEWDEEGRVSLRTVNRSYQSMLRNILWNKPYGMVLTSGTLAAGHDMEFLKGRLGLDKVDRITETMTPSPFDYQHNSLLFFPGDMPSCKENTIFRKAAAEQVSELIRATAGHTLVLCTSYTEMRELFHLLRDMALPYPLFAMYRNGAQYLKEFKESGNGVLLASGPCWEGMDFPGDLVSSLIIPRLPFPRRDALHEGERNSHREVRDFILGVAQPEMLVKLKQGFGRGIRLMSDSCVTSILDSRAAPGGAYHQAVMDALPECGSTRSLEFVEAFIQSKKDISYYMEDLADV